MEKVVVQIKPELADYSRVIFAYTTRKRMYWFGIGAISACSVVFFLLAIWMTLDGDGNLGLTLVAIAIFLLLLVSFSLLTGWFSARSLSNKKQATLPITYEFDDEEIVVRSAVAEGKYSWAMFNKAYENKQYLMFGYSVNKKMVQFIPRRAFDSREHESTIRAVVGRKLGEIENIEKGLTGWKLSLVIGITTLFLFACLGVSLFLLFSIL